MTKQEFDKLFNKKMEELKELRDSKHDEYAEKDETFRNLKDGARKLGIHPMLYAFTLMTKQYNSLHDYVKEWNATGDCKQADLDRAWEKCQDIIVYCFLTYGLWVEGDRNNNLFRKTPRLDDNKRSFLAKNFRIEGVEIGVKKRERVAEEYVSGSVEEEREKSLRVVAGETEEKKACSPPLLMHTSSLLRHIEVTGDEEWQEGVIKEHDAFWDWPVDTLERHMGDSARKRLKRGLSMRVEGEIGEIVPGDMEELGKEQHYGLAYAYGCVFVFYVATKEGKKGWYGSCYYKQFYLHQVEGESVEGLLMEMLNVAKEALKSGRIGDIDKDREAASV